MITKKDFVALAKDLKALKDTNEKEVFINVLCKHFNYSNPLFNENKFREACKNGGEQND